MDYRVSFLSKVKAFLLGGKTLVVILTITLSASVYGGYHFVSSILGSSSSTPSSPQEVPATNGQVDAASTVDPVVPDTPSPSDQTVVYTTPAASPSPSPSVSPTPTPTNLGIPDGSHSSLSVNPGSLNADGSTSNLVLTLNDGGGNALSSATVTLVASGVNINPTNGGSNITNASGQAYFTASSTTSGTMSINAQIQYNGSSYTLSGIGSITFNAVATPTPTPTEDPSASSSATP